ncbi:olfactory receptor 11A1-like [Carettochelys insculpta]|uniref:olfactory receptor 11A1-like n=1 Tax=Carettochelys insculpta TaxID=44489 RepID=UPI003EB6B481
MASREQGNQTFITEFTLLGFGNPPELQTQLFLLFLVIYIATVVGNMLIVVLVLSDQRLRSPMYVFLGNLSLLETFYTSTILPRLLASLLSGDRAIAVHGCIVQFYFFASLVGSECCLLSAMSYDRYLAICRPLHYAARMSASFCLRLVAGCWISGFVSIALIVFLMSQLTFCGPREIDHFFCDFTPVIKLSCSDSRPMELVTFTLSSLFTLPPFLLTLASYICIISTILQIPSALGRQKAFSTCSSHLTGVTIFYGTLIIVYLLPRTETMRALNKVFSVFYTVLTPLANPLIYSLRNKEVKGALRKAIGKLFV